MKILLFTTLLCLTFATLADAKPRPKRSSVCGTVLEKRGNQMPDPDQPRSAGVPVRREVLLFRVLNQKNVAMSDDGFMSDLRGAKPLRSATSDARGRFCFRNVAPGRYTLLIREPKGLYANLFEGDGQIHPVAVRAGKSAKTEIVISHGATF